MRNRTKTRWYRTGDCRIVPWWFGLMRAEFLEHRDFKLPETGETMEFQSRWVSAGRFPEKYDGSDALGFWSTLATPAKDMRYGKRALWVQFITFFSAPEKKVSKNDMASSQEPRCPALSDQRSVS